MKKFILGFLLLSITQTSLANENSLSIPMTIFGDITYSQNLSGSTLNIYNTDKYLLNSLQLSGNNYGSNNAFEIEKRINLNKFDNSLVFEIISGNTRFSNITSTSTGNYNCSETPNFQTNKLCKYDLNLTNATKSNLVNLGNINNLQISNIKDTSLTLTWDNIANIDGFVIINKNSNTQIKQTSNIYNFIDLLPNTNYTFQIYSYKGNNTGDIKEITIKTISTPKQLSSGKIDSDSSDINDLKNDKDKIISTSDITQVKQAFSQILSLNTSNDSKITVLQTPISFDNNSTTQERIVFLPQDTTKKTVFSIPAGVKPNNNAIIYPPIVLDRKDDLKTKMENANLKVSIVGAMEVPTSEATTFNGDIELCMPANGRTVIGNLVIYSSSNGTNWQKDTYAKDMTISNDQICFKTNHLTSFASLEETLTQIQNTSSSSGGGGGGGALANCLDTQLICNNGVYYRKTGVSCNGGNLGKTCSITSTGNTNSNINSGNTNSNINKVIKKELTKEEILTITKEIKKEIFKYNGVNITISIPKFDTKTNEIISKINKIIIQKATKSKLKTKDTQILFSSYSKFLLGLKFHKLNDPRGRQISKDALKNMLKYIK